MHTTKLGGDLRTGPWQTTGAVAEGGPAHPDAKEEEHFNRVLHLVAGPL